MSHLDSQFYFQIISRVLPNISDLQLSTFVLDFFLSATVKVEVKNVFLLWNHLSAGRLRKILDVKGQFAEM